MARGGGAKFYSVARGRKIGVFKTWDECKAQVEGHSGAQFKSFSTEHEALAFLKSVKDASVPSTVSSTKVQPHPQPHPCRTAAARSPSASAKSIAVTVEEARCPVPKKTMFSFSSRPHDDLDHHSKQSSQSPISVYVDGSCLNNGKSNARGGFGGYYGHNDSRNFSFPLHADERQTNNRGELKAVIHVLEHAIASHSTAPLVIHTDSRYCIDGITSWIHKWKRTDYKGVENVDLWKRLDAAVADWRRIYATTTGGAIADAVKFVHVKGHSGVHGNEMADRLAVEGSRKAC